MDFAFEQAGEIPASGQRWKRGLSSGERHRRNVKSIVPRQLEKVSNRESAGLLARVFRKDQLRPSTELLVEIVCKFEKHLGCDGNANFGTHNAAPTIFNTPLKNSLTPFGSVSPSARSRMMFNASGASGHRMGSPGGSGSDDAPYSMESTLPSIPANTTAKREMPVIARTVECAANPARKIMNSLMNGPNGGKPMSARMPQRNAIPVQGAAFNNPRTERISVVRYFKRMLPDKRNNMDFDNAWFTIWSS